MTLPLEYDAAQLQRELDSLKERLDRAERYMSMRPLSAAPLNPKEGWIAVSDGTSSGFDGSSGAGVYQYRSAAWVFVG